MLPKLQTSPCAGCKDRSIDPPCHNPDICEKWKAYREHHDQISAKRKNESDIDAMYHDLLRRKGKK